MTGRFNVDEKKRTSCSSDIAEAAIWPLPVILSEPGGGMVAGSNGSVVTLVGATAVVVAAGRILWPFLPMVSS